MSEKKPPTHVDALTDLLGRQFEISQHASHMEDALLYGQAASRIHRPGTAQAAPIIKHISAEDMLKRWAVPPMTPPMPMIPPMPDVKTFSNAELIHEMLERGFAVMKLPAAGGPPEVLKDG